MDQEKIANLIKTIRKENNLTQKDLGDSLGVSAQAVSKWENGKNIPDIALIKEISDKYNIDINDLLDGENIKTSNSNRNKYLFIGIAVLAVILIGLIIFIPRNDFNSSTISSQCKEFKLQGIISYNVNKSAISISKIEYCGNKDDTRYNKLSCKLYEQTKSDKKVVAICDEKNDITLNDFLNGLSFNITNYEQSCKKYESGVLRLEIIGTSEGGIEEKYVVPLSLDEKC